MIQFSLNGIFAYLSARLAWMAWKRAAPFLRTGWGIIRAEVSHPDFRQHVERRRKISFGGGFLLGGLLWAGVCAAALGFGLFFTVEAARILLA